MDETTTPATPEMNGHAPDEQAAARSVAPSASDGDKLPLTAEGREYLADMKWVDQQYDLGNWVKYTGNYIAVFRKKLLGFGIDLLALREQVAREHNVSPDRILIDYIDPGPIT